MLYHIILSRFIGCSVRFSVTLYLGHYFVCFADAKPPESGQTFPRSSNLSQESIQIHKVLTEFLAGLTKPAAEDVRRQMQVRPDARRRQLRTPVKVALHAPLLNYIDSVIRSVAGLLAVNVCKR